MMLLLIIIIIIIINQLIMLTKILKIGNTLTRYSKPSFATNKISDIIQQLSSKIYQEQLIKDQKQEQILKNYIELTQESYLENLMHQNKLLKQQSRKIDPKIILMILPTLQKEQAIREHLLMLFPHLPIFTSKQLLLFYQYLLAYKFTTKPKIPSPKSLIGCESLLIILAQIYPKDFLIQWLKQVPLYNGNNTYMISMGAFSIIYGLSEKVRNNNKKLIQRCYQRIKQLYSEQDSQARIGVVILGLEMKLQFIQQLILIPYSLDFREIDGIKISLCVIQLDRYLKDKYGEIKSINPFPMEKQSEFQEDIQIDQGVSKQEKKINPNQFSKSFVYDEAEPQHIKFKLEEYLQKIAKILVHRDWKNVIKLHTLVRLFNVLDGKKLEKVWLRFGQKLFNFTLKKQQIATLSNLTTGELVGMVQVLQKLKINKPALLKNLLVVLSDRLETADKEQLIRLSKCLVTYVRLCQDYLIHFRAIIQRRKFIFTYDDIQRLNDNFRRVQVLFPKPLTY